MVDAVDAMSTVKESVVVGKGMAAVIPAGPPLSPTELKTTVLSVYQICRERYPDKEPELPALLRNYRGREREVSEGGLSAPSLHPENL